MTFAKVAVAIALATLFAMAGCSSEKAEAVVGTKTEPMAIRVGTAESRQVERTLAVTGSLLPDETVTISFEAAGRITEIAVDFGQTVRKGQVLAELDRREYELQLERSRAALAQALARVGLDSSQEDATPKETPAIRQARAQFEDARSKYESAAKLVETGDISRERSTELEKQMLARKAAVEAAEDDLRTQLANIAALRADRKLAEKRLADTVVRAPFDGSVAEKLVSIGQYVKDNTPILRLVKTYPLRLRLDVPETGAAAVRVGDTLRFTTSAAPGKEFRASVRELNPSLDARSRSLTAEARMTGTDPLLRPGMFVQVELVIARNARVVVVPKDAVYTMAGLTKVFTLDGNRVKEHRIVLGQERDGWIEVPAEVIPEGTLVARSNVQNLTDGAEVRRQ